jgi:hypothetical protein
MGLRRVMDEWIGSFVEWRVSEVGKSECYTLFSSSL